MKNAVRVAAEFANRGINDSIERGPAAPVSQIQPRNLKSRVPPRNMRALVTFVFVLLFIPLFIPLFILTSTGEVQLKRRLRLRLQMAIAFTRTPTEKVIEPSCSRMAGASPRSRRAGGDSCRRGLPRVGHRGDFVRIRPVAARLPKRGLEALSRRAGRGSILTRAQARNLFSLSAPAWEATPLVMLRPSPTRERLIESFCSIRRRRLPERMKGRKLFIVTRDDRSGDVRDCPESPSTIGKPPTPRNSWSSKGQPTRNLFSTRIRSPRLLQELLRFLSEP